MSGLQSGSRVGAWELTTRIGEGGGGHVWRARGPAGEVALKLIAPELVAHEEVRLRFMREVAAMRSVVHPNIVRYLDAGEIDGELFLVMELVDGDTLETRLATVGRLPPEEVTRIGCAVADGLGAVHAAGLVHRDVKPTNVLLCADGPTKLIDFGIAKWTDMDMTQMTKTGHMMGTPNYMAPEQASGVRSANVRTDVWGLGATLYDAAVGHPPFGGDDPPLMAMVARILKDDPQPLPDSLPASLRSVILKALAKDPSDRFASMAELRRGLTHAPPRRRASMASMPSVELSKGPQFVGRKREMMTVGAALMEAASEETAAVLVISAPPGLGRTRMLTELRSWAAQRLAGSRFIQVHADPLKRLSSCSLMRALLQATEVDTSHLDDRQRLFLGDLVGGEAFDARLDEARGDSRVFSEGMFDAVRRLFARWCEASAVFVLVDDLHAADEASLVMLERLLLELSGAPFVLVATAEADATWKRHPVLEDAKAVELAALDAAPLTKIVRSVRPDLNDTEIGRIVARAGGSPAFAVELALARRGVETLPPSAEAAIRARLAELTEPERRVLAHAAVLGATFTTDALVAIGAVEATQEMGHLVRGGFIAAEGGGWVFCDRIALRVAAEMLTADERQRAHSAAAAWLRGHPDPNPAIVAHHLEQAGEREAAAKQWINVVSRSEMRADLHTVLDASERALALPISTELEAELRISRAEAFVAFAREEALEHELDRLEALDAALGEGSPAGARMRTLRGQQLAAHDTELAIAKHHEAIAIADRTGDVQLRVHARCELVTLLSRVDAERALIIANGALALARSGVSRLTLAEVHGVRALAANYLGQRGLALRSFARHVAELEGAGVGDVRLVKARNNWGYALAALGAHADAVQVLEDTRVVAERRGHTLIAAWVHQNLGLALAHVGEAERGMKLALAAERFAIEHGVAGLAIASRLYVAAIANLQHMPELALEKLDMALAEARALNRITVQASCHIQLARAHNLRGDHTLAIAATDVALAIQDQEGGIPEFEVDLWRARQEAFAALGRAAEAGEAQLIAERLAANDDAWLSETATVQP